MHQNSWWYTPEKVCYLLFNLSISLSSNSYRESLKPPKSEQSHTSEPFMSCNRISFAATTYSCSLSCRCFHCNVILLFHLPANSLAVVVNVIWWKCQLWFCWLCFTDQTPCLAKKSTHYSDVLFTVRSAVWLCFPWCNSLHTEDDEVRHVQSRASPESKISAMQLCFTKCSRGTNMMFYWSNGPVSPSTAAQRTFLTVRSSKCYD